MTETKAPEPTRSLSMTGISLAVGATVFMLLVGAPLLLAHIQSESGMCGKEMNRIVTSISSLKSDKNVEGSFFLGTGSIRTERVYVAYTGNNYVGYSLIERPISQSLLFEDENESPYVEEVTVWRCDPYGYTPNVVYKFHVPVGTIMMEYKV